MTEVVFSLRIFFSSSNYTSCLSLGDLNSNNMHTLFHSDILDRIVLSPSFILADNFLLLFLASCGHATNIMILLCNDNVLNI